jgi:signal transduction histidine kinase/ligand-binding sensor domain-containing protein
MRLRAHFINVSPKLRLIRQCCLAACLLGWLLGGVALAQYRFDSWTTDNGLPQNSITGITQTKDGYLWLTTFDGLVRFDGVRFTVFERTGTRGLPSNRLTTLFADRAGTLWIGTEDSGLVRYQDGVFTAFTTEHGLPHNLVRWIYEDDAGTLVIVTQGGIVYWRAGRFAPAPESGYFSQRRVYYSRSGALWVFDGNGLRRFKDGVWRTYGLAWSATTGTGRNAKFYEDRAGNIWFSANLLGLYCIKGDELSAFSEKLGLPRTAEIWHIYEDSAGSIWVCTYGAGLFQYQTDRASVYTKADGLSSSNARCIFEDREGTLWVGTADRGLNRLTKQFLTTYSAAQGVGNGNVYPIYEDPTGTIWLGADWLTKLSNGKFTNYTRAEFPVFANLRSLAMDRTGRLWIGQVGGLFSLKDGQLTNHSQLVSLAGFQFTATVHSTHEDRTGALWFGSDAGLFKLHGDTVTRYTTKDGLPGDDVKIVYEDRAGTLWFGTYGGLARWQDGRFVSFTVKDGLKSNRVRSLYEDADGVLWIGTYDGGLSRLKQGRITSCTTEQGLFNNGVFQILEDQRGNFWLSCNQGIYRVSRQQLNDFADGRIPKVNALAFGKREGMLTTECNGGEQPAGVKTRDGKLWFPTQEGAVVVDPEAVPFNAAAPPVLIESVILDRVSLPFQNGIEIRPGQANLEINYTGLSFIRAEQVRFKYKLIGQDQAWVEVGTRRVAYYPYLPPGEYTFTVIAANSDGVWNEQGASLRLRVIPPFYRTWWFITLALLSVIGAAVVAVRYRLAQLQRKHEAQAAFSRQLIESQEAERKRIAAELHDGLGQSLLVIKNRSLLGTMSPTVDGEAKDQFDEIAAATNQAIEEVRQIAYNLRPYHLDRLGLTQTIEAMLEKVSEASGINFIADIALLDGIFTNEGEVTLYRIVQESVNNIIKHAQATEARVQIRRAADQVTLKIEDDGRGFNPLTPATNGQPVKGGFGLIGMAERARMLGGAYAIESAPGKGTMVTVTIPIPAESEDERNAN